MNIMNFELGYYELPSPWGEVLLGLHHVFFDLVRY